MSYQLMIEPLGETIEIEENQTLLDAALRHGVYLPHACCHGLCGTCKVRVLEGEVDHGEPNPFALMDFEREEGFTLACCATPLSDVLIEADVEEDPDALLIPLRDFQTVVERIEDLTPTVKGIWLRLDEPLSFQAGQYVNVHLPNIGSRAFSIANSPQEVSESGLIELNVRRVPGGVGTSHLHVQLRVGDRLPISGPNGRFFVRRSHQKPLLFIAGGTGLSSVRSMLRDLHAQNWGKPVTLIYGQRNRDELYYHDELCDLAERWSLFEYVPALSDEPSESPWAGARGFVHEVAKSRFGGNFSGYDAYLCGPPPMIEACICTLLQGRLGERDIFTEKFYTAADTIQRRSPLFKRL